MAQGIEKPIIAGIVRGAEAKPATRYVANRLNSEKVKGLSTA